MENEEYLEIISNSIDSFNMLIESGNINDRQIELAQYFNVILTNDNYTLQDKAESLQALVHIVSDNELEMKSYENEKVELRNALESIDIDSIGIRDTNPMVYEEICNAIEKYKIEAESINDDMSYNILKEQVEALKNIIEEMKQLQEEIEDEYEHEGEDSQPQFDEFDEEEYDNNFIMESYEVENEEMEENVEGMENFSI